MTEYSGDKAFDAEMFIDLQTGKLTMDYTLNKNIDIFDSNYGCTLKNEFKDQKYIITVYEVMRSMIIAGFFLLYICFTLPIITYCFHRGVIKNKNYQIEHQKLMKYMASNVFGTVVEVIDAPIRESHLTVHIHSNMWISYKLEGDFETYIKSIALKRSFRKTMTFGKYERIQQHGWDITFEFTNPPVIGKCIVVHL